ncbi:MAG TPA: MmcQ/YjbR family DNA-binding protein [Mycobacteriales bacterium]|nr:MmcQ/YjbR family DNA-binding protein [Mycobacteriales bacterium]
MDAPLDLPEEFVNHVREICLALPEVATRVDESQSPARSTAYVFDVRRRPFCTLIAAQNRNGRARTMVVLRARPGERAALIAAGAPFFAPRGAPDRLGILVSAGTDWMEVRELVTESYRLIAPKKLTALID